MREHVPSPRTPSPTSTAFVSALLLASLLAAGCGTALAGTPARTNVAGSAVTAVSGLDPVTLLADLPDAVTAGWEVAGAGAPVPVTLADIRQTDSDRADRYAAAGFQAGARLSLSRGDADRIAVMVDRFPHAAAARQVGDWHLSSAGVTLADGVSLVGTTAEGVVVLEDMLVRVVAIGEEVPDEDTVRTLMAAAEEVLAPRS